MKSLKNIMKDFRAAFRNIMLVAEQGMREREREREREKLFTFMCLAKSCLIHSIVIDDKFIHVI